MILSLEMVTVPVADVDRAKAFYVDQLGFRPDMDVRTEGDRRFVRLTPPGSACCIAIGEGWVDSQPGSLQGTQLVVEDVDAVHEVLRGRGVDVSEVQEFPWGRFCFFSDPDGRLVGAGAAGGVAANRAPISERGPVAVVG